ncbi:MAG TPA: 3-deoxy-manno-octulosonate cytidylyltransferase [Flavobacteriaceae bacterium]|nr:3-deoxy-manno-octulosonate cytidylyltransferase [Flavobacteriaceae bacterium]
MKVIAMIPARYAASRFPGKLMKDLGGKPVIIRTYEATKNTKLFDEVYVVTDSDKIYDTIIEHGGKALRSKAEHESGSDRIAEAVANMDVDIVVNVQGDEPFTKRDGLKKLLAIFRNDPNEQVDLGSLMSVITEQEDIQNPNVVKVVVDKNNRALYFSRSPIPYVRDETIKNPVYRHIGIYAFRKQALLDFASWEMGGLEATEKIECLRFLEYGKTIELAVNNEVSIGIDSPEDLEKAIKYLNERKTNL